MKLGVFYTDGQIGEFDDVTGFFEADDRIVFKADKGFIDYTLYREYLMGYALTKESGDKS